VNQLLDRWIDVIEVERATRINYIGKIKKHIRPSIGLMPVTCIWLNLGSAS
jgi:integrase